MMAVHAQYVPNALFVPDFQTITTTTTTTTRNIPTDNNNDDNGFKGEQLNGQRTLQVLNGSAVLSGRNSDLSCNAASAPSRKRNRDTAAAMIDQSSQFPIPTKIQPIFPNYQQNQMVGSAGMSTSGRRPILPPQSQHGTEIDQLIRLHSAKIISGVGEIQKRHYIDIIRICENQSAKKIAEKDAEIETLKRTQAELEARLKQVTAENQVWFTVVRNSESIVAGLKGSLDQALRRRGAECHAAGAHAAEDAESCCYEGDSEDRRRPVRGVCRVCNEKSVSVLVLPCRHLCLCLQCEPVSETCPICYGAKNVGLQVFME